MPEFPTPHLLKLQACLRNASLPQADKVKVEEAIIKYNQWMTSLNAVSQGEENAVKTLVEATNTYKRFIELDLIFDSNENFLYRQKGQLKLDNTIIEEFLPHVVFKGLTGLNEDYEFGPRKTFAGLNFLSSIGNTGAGGTPSLRVKDQDFILGKKLFIKTGFDRNFESSTLIESHLGYVCIECKTNLDKTMFQEAVATSRDLKIAVPSSQYFLVCEFLDMTPLSITSSQIDDILILRKSKRLSANIRQKYKTAALRREHREEYVTFIDASKYYPDVFQAMIDRIQSVLDVADPDEGGVLQKGSFR